VRLSLFPQHGHGMETLTGLGVSCTSDSSWIFFLARSEGVVMRSEGFTSSAFAMVTMVLSPMLLESRNLVRLGLAISNKSASSDLVIPFTSRMNSTLLLIVILFHFLQSYRVFVRKPIGLH